MTLFYDQIPVTNLLLLLLLLAGCGPGPAEREAARQLPAPAPRPAPAKPAGPAYTSGDREATGPLDTLHVGRGLVLRLVPGSKSDFPAAPQQYASFSEARLIRREGDGQVRRVGPTLVVRPFNGPALHFTNTQHTQAEELDVRCTFAGSLPGRPYWVVDSLQWERFQPFLVQKHSGRSTLLTNNPEISPNRNFLFVATPGLDSESDGNLLEMLTISDQAVTPHWTRFITHWQPQQARWLDNHTIAIEQLRFEPKQDTTYVRLLLP